MRINVKKLDQIVQNWKKSIESCRTTINQENIRLLKTEGAVEAADVIIRECLLDEEPKNEIDANSSTDE